MKTNTKRLASTVLAALLCGQAGATLHAATNILQGPDQIVPGTANENAGPNPLGPAGLTGGPRSIFMREEALGDLDGLRREAEELGIAISPSYLERCRATQPAAWHRA